MHYVYLIQSIKFPKQKYIGYTTNIKKRLQTHNWGGNKHTTKYKPWNLIVYLAFENEDKAKAFEKYLKSGAGYAFAKKRFW